MDFTKKLGTSASPHIPSWLDGIFSTAKVVKKASTEEHIIEAPVEPQLDLAKEDIEQILLANDRLSRLEKEAEEEVATPALPRMDALVRPYSEQAQEKIAAHWAGDTPEDRKKAEGDVVNDGDKVREAEESKFEAEASATEQRLDKETGTERNMIWDAAKDTKKEAGVVKKVVKKAEDEDKKEEEKEKKEEEKKESSTEEAPEVSAEDLETKLAVRAYRRKQLLEKVAAKASEEYSKQDNKVKFNKSWYDEIVGDKTNVGNVREAEVEAGVEKEAAANVGLDFGDDPKADGSLGDFKVGEVFDENAEVVKDIESESYMKGDEENYSSELGETHKASSEQLKKEAHYNNRTQGMDDDGPTAPEQQDTGRDTFLRTWWIDQVKKSEAFIKKEYQILGDGKKETHMDAIPVFEGKATKKAWLTERHLKREAIASAAVGEAGSEKNLKGYYADAYGDSSYAASLVAEPKGGKSEKKAETVESRRALRHKIAGIEDDTVKVAEGDGMEKEAGLAALLPMITNVATKLGPVALQAIKNPAVQNLIASFLQGKPDAKEADIEAAVQDAIKKTPIVAATEGDLTKTAQAYGEPVKEPDSTKVGDPDWNSSELTRNSIVDAPQADVIKQLEQAISNVREAVKKKK